MARSIRKIASAKACRKSPNCSKPMSAWKSRSSIAADGIITSTKAACRASSQILLRDLGQGVAAFNQDMGDRMGDVVFVSMSEFGRTAHENGNRGTDHGHANCMFVMGGDIKGGRVYTRWPGLNEGQLNQGRDLAVTTDYRSVLGEIINKHLGDRDLSTVFPGFANDPHQFLGLVKA